MKTIFTGFSPNTRMEDVRIALSFLIFPSKWLTWKKGVNSTKAEKMLTTYFGGKTVLTYDSGRTALHAALTSMHIKEGDEVLVQAFTCVVVINAIRWTGATPIYVDIEEHTLNMNPQDARKKCTSKTKAIIIQHTFGLPADIDSLLRLAKEYNLRTIEDCAHSLGSRYNKSLTGTFADIGMLSFGAEKNISCARGGALVINDQTLEAPLSSIQQTLPHMSTYTIFQHLLHVVVFPFGKRWYHAGIGKLFLKLVKELHLTHSIITKKEKKGCHSGARPSTLPNALASLLVQQITQIDAFNRHRRTIANVYKTSSYKTQIDKEGRVFLRYPILVTDREKTLKQTKQKGILLGNWYNSVVAPNDCNSARTGYIQGSCPVAEKCSRHVVNLPTNIHIDKESALYIVNALSE